MKKINVAIDGFSGTGKSSTAKQVAGKLGYKYIDSGAMYRAVTFYFLQNQVDQTNLLAVTEALSHIFIDFKIDQNGQSVLMLNEKPCDDELRSVEINELVSTISAIKEVRQKLVSIQYEIGKNKEVVMDGRDIGTVVFPDAELKIFMNADAKIRAERRFMELKEKGIEASIEEIEANLLQRDSIDSNRKDSPLVKAKDAIEIDTTHLTFEDQVNAIVERANAVINES